MQIIPLVLDLSAVCVTHWGLRGPMCGLLGTRRHHQHDLLRRVLCVQADSSVLRRAFLLIFKGIPAAAQSREFKKITAVTFLFQITETG